MMASERYQNITALVQEINSSTKTLGTCSINDGDGARLQALEAARKLVAALTTPTETILHHSYEANMTKLQLRNLGYSSASDPSSEHVCTARSIHEPFPHPCQ